MRANCLIRASVSSAYRRMKCSARSTGRHSRLCLWHQYGPACGSRGESRAKWVVSRADRAARASTTRRTPARPPALRHVSAEQRLDELRDELPEVRVEAVDVLRPLALG